MASVYYFMHIDWRWIKQRPQFLAEELQRGGHAVRVFDRRIWRTDIVTNNPTSLDVRGLRASPGRLRLPSALDRGLLRTQARWTSRGEIPDLVWVTHPSITEYLPPRLSGATLVYDAMDDHAALAPPSERPRIQQLERALLARADLVLASSETILNNIRESTWSSSTPLLVRNGLPYESSATYSPAMNSREVMRLGYVGTISKWLDLDSLLYLLGECEDVEVHLFGPADVQLPAHPRLVHHGPVSRADLAARVSACHAFIMPFVDSPIVRAVDPVKVYEYLSWNRPTFVSEWAETEHFGELIKRYRTAEELLSLVQHFRHHEASLVPDRTLVEEFLRYNTWRSRGDQIRSALHSLLQGRKAA